MTGLSKSKAAKRAQYIDLMRRGYGHVGATREVAATDEAIDRARAAKKGLDTGSRSK